MAWGNAEVPGWQAEGSRGKDAPTKLLFRETLVGRAAQRVVGRGPSVQSVGRPGPGEEDNDALFRLSKSSFSTALSGLN